MMRLFALIAGAILSASCAADLPSSPTLTPVPPSTAASSIRVTASSGSDTAAIVATVLTANGAFVSGAPVTFAISSGSITPTSATTDAAGSARAIASSTAASTITVTSGALTQSIALGATAAPPIVAPPPVVPPAPPPVVVPPPPPPPTPVLSAIVECTPAAVGSPTGCHVSMTSASGQAITSTITSIGWDWGDGIVEAAIAAPPTTRTHIYSVSGTYLVSAAATAPAGTVTARTNTKIP